MFDRCPLASRVIGVCLAVGFLVAIASALAGCGGGGDDTSADASTDPKKRDVPPMCAVNPTACI